MRIALALGIVFCAGTAHAWGERGHDAVTRVAVRLVAARLGDDPSLSTPLLAREHMLAHLSNVPDIVWRAAKPEVVRANSPTHYVNWEKIVTAPTILTIPRKYAKASELARQRGLDMAKDVGTAPWRVEQLANEMTLALKRVKQLPPADIASGGKAFEDAVNDALLYAGLLSHFVGDLSQPFHSTQDSDGWDTGQGGIHAYFETDLVNVQPLQLEADVYAVALSTDPAKSIIIRSGIGVDALEIALAESMDALQYVDELRVLDREHALTALGDKVKQQAKRKPPAQVAQAFAPVIVERLATGADLLCAIWINAWNAAGKPDMRAYRSYAYPVAPEFVAPSYVSP